MYETQSGEAVPDAVAEQFAHPDDWENFDPTKVGVVDANFDELYHGINSGDLKEVYVDDRGNVYHHDSFERVEKFQPAALPRPDRYCRHPFTYNDSPDIVSRDHFAEHVTRVIVIEEDAKFALNSRSGVLWTDFENDPVSDEAIELAVSLAETRIPHGTDNCEIETPDEYTRARRGWHSSMEPSEQSELVNLLTNGKIDPAWEDDETIDVYPYAVRFGDTTNVCSQPASIWSTETFASVIERHFNNARAAPAYAGLK